MPLELAAAEELVVLEVELRDVEVEVVVIRGAEDVELVLELAVVVVLCVLLLEEVVREIVDRIVPLAVLDDIVLEAVVVVVETKLELPLEVLVGTIVDPVLELLPDVIVKLPRFDELVLAVAAAVLDTLPEKLFVRTVDVLLDEIPDALLDRELEVLLDKMLDALLDVLDAKTLVCGSETAVAVLEVLVIDDTLVAEALTVARVTVPLSIALVVRVRVWFPV